MTDPNKTDQPKPEHQGKRRRPPFVRILTFAALGAGATSCMTCNPPPIDRPLDDAGIIDETDGGDRGETDGGSAAI